MLLSVLMRIDSRTGRPSGQLGRQLVFHLFHPFVLHLSFLTCLVSLTLLLRMRSHRSSSVRSLFSSARDHSMVSTMGIHLSSLTSHMDNNLGNHLSHLVSIMAVSIMDIHRGSKEVMMMRYIQLR
jgi:hypothetical protein